MYWNAHALLIPVGILYLWFDTCTCMMSLLHHHLQVDIYSYGIVLFQLITSGHTPFEELSVHERDRAIEQVPTERESSTNPVVLTDAGTTHSTCITLWLSSLAGHARSDHRLSPVPHH